MLPIAVGLVVLGKWILGAGAVVAAGAAVSNCAPESPQEKPDGGGTPDASFPPTDGGDNYTDGGNELDASFPPDASYITDGGQTICEDGGPEQDGGPTSDGGPAPDGGNLTDGGQTCVDGGLACFDGGADGGRDGGQVSADGGTDAGVPNVCNHIPYSFNLSSPVNNEEVPLDPTIIWNGTSDSDPNDHVTYRVIISKSRNFNSTIDGGINPDIVLDVINITETSYHVPADKLSNGQTYYWKVIAYDSCVPPNQRASTTFGQFHTVPLPVDAGFDGGIDAGPAPDAGVDGGTIPADGGPWLDGGPQDGGPAPDGGAEPNHKPVARITGNTQVPETGGAPNYAPTTITLNGSTSDDGDPDKEQPLAYQWSQVGAGANNAIVNPRQHGSYGELFSFEVPNVSYANRTTGLNIKIRLIANDGQTQNNISDPTDTDINVSFVNRPPSVNAGADREVTSGNAITLTATGGDPDVGQPLTYSWQRTDTTGLTISLNGQGTSQLSFTAPQVDRDTTVSFEVTAYDGMATASDTVDVLINRNCIVNMSYAGCLSLIGYGADGGQMPVYTVGGGPAGPLVDKFLSIPSADGGIISIYLKYFADGGFLPNAVIFCYHRKLDDSCEDVYDGGPNPPPTNICSNKAIFEFSPMTNEYIWQLFAPNSAFSKAELNGRKRPSGQSIFEINWNAETGGIACFYPFESILFSY